MKEIYISQKMMIIIDGNINHQQALGMGQNTLGDHMHIQSIRSRHRACNIFAPLLDALLINARTVPALFSYLYKHKYSI